MAVGYAAAIVDLENLVNEKADHWQASISWGAVGVGAILFLGLFGGLK